MLDELTRRSDQETWMRDAVERYESSLVRYTRRITGDWETARDVVQEAFLKLCREPRDKVEGHLAAWLFTVCRRRALDVLKKESRMKTSIQGSALDRSAADGAAALDDREVASQVLDLIGQLPANQQEVVRLKFEAGLSYRDISAITELTVSNVGYLLHTALQTLRRQLVEPHSG